MDLGDVIPQPGVTVIVGGAGAATLGVAVKIAATVCRGEGLAGLLSRFARRNFLDVRC